MPPRDKVINAHEGERPMPDSFSGDCFVGWRTWKIDTTILTKGHIWLHSIYISNAYWKPMETMVAICDYEKRFPGENFEKAPRANCDCGIHAYYEYGPAWNYMRSMVAQSSVVGGQVSLWGRIIRCQQGWRAEYAYPYAFVVPEFPNDSHHEVARALRRQFRVDTEIIKVKGQTK